MGTRVSILGLISMLRGMGCLRRETEQKNFYKRKRRERRSFQQEETEETERFAGK
jgi:hypothetical protein